MAESGEGRRAERRSREATGVRKMEQIDLRRTLHWMIEDEESE